MIKIGIEVSRRKLFRDLLDNPGRYFFVLYKGGRVDLCIQTCNHLGEDIKMHMINGFALNQNGELISLFDEGIEDSILKSYEWKRRTPEGMEYPISSHLEHTLCRMPDLMDWIISRILIRDRNLVINPS